MIASLIISALGGVITGLGVADIFPDKILAAASLGVAVFILALALLSALSEIADRLYKLSKPPKE